MIKGGTGGANTNISGLNFEKKVDVKTAFQGLKGYEIKGDDVCFGGEKVAEIHSKYDLYKWLSSKFKIDWKQRLSKRLVPDDAIFVIKHNTLYIIEKKYQGGSGSVDEKLQTCDYKLKQYKKLFSGSNLRVEIVYVLNNWFDKAIYRDTYRYMEDAGSSHFFENLPFSFLGLPSPRD